MSDMSGRGRLRFCRFGKFRAVRQGRLGQVWFRRYGEVRCGEVRCGEVGWVRFRRWGTVRCGGVWRGSAGGVRCGEVR